MQENILAESVAMIPDTRQRLQAAVEELRQLLVGWANRRTTPLLKSSFQCAQLTVQIEHASEAGESEEYRTAKQEEELAAPLFD